MSFQAFVTPLAIPFLSPRSATAKARAPTVAALSGPASSSTLHLDWLPTHLLPSSSLTPAPFYTYITAPAPPLTPAQAAWSARIAALTAPVDTSSVASATSPVASNTSPVDSNTSPVDFNTSPALSGTSVSSAQPSAPTPVVPTAPPAPAAAQTVWAERVARLAPTAEPEAPAIVFSAKAVPAFAPAPKSVYEARMARLARIVAGEIEACEDVAESRDQWDRLAGFAAGGEVPAKKAEESGEEGKSGGIIGNVESFFRTKSGISKIEEAAAAPVVTAPIRASGDGAKTGGEGWQASSARQALLAEAAVTKVGAAVKVGAPAAAVKAVASVDREIVGRSRELSAVASEGDAVSGGGTMALDSGDGMESHNVEVVLSSTILAVFLGVCLTISERFSEIAHHAAGSGMM